MAVVAEFRSRAMTKLEANKELCRKFFTHIGKREFTHALTCVSDDVIWWVQGDTPASGYRHGKDSLFSDLEGSLSSDLTISFGDLTAEDDRVALEMRSHATLTSGKSYANTYHFLLTIKDGLITQGREYLDTKHLCETIFASGNIR
jgi:ketosteroid isomerase-like protein